MKTKPQKQIDLTDITTTLQTHSLTDARTYFASSVGSSMETTGVVLKVVRRDSNLKLHLQTVTDGTTRPMEIFADFPSESEQQKVKDTKIKKGSTVTITGAFQTFGTYAITMTDCRLKG